jgi:hypothetical protein
MYGKYIVRDAGHFSALDMQAGQASAFGLACSGQPKPWGFYAFQIGEFLLRVEMGQIRL